MPFRKKNKQVDAPTPEEVAALGHKHEVEAAKDKKSSVYDHFHAQEEAKAVADAKKRKKRYAIILTSLLAILLIMYIISMLTTQWGDLVISIGDLYDGKSIMLSESASFDDAAVKLNGGSVKDVTNITKAWLPKGLDNEKDGQHNGENYLAYTFYLKNTGDKDLKYNTRMNITGVSKSADEAIRIQIYRNGKDNTYAKTSYKNRKIAETDATAWKTTDNVLNIKNTDLKAGSTDKYTVVMWIEGNDPECVDAIRGGTIRSQMVFDVVPDNPEDAKK
ncbi:MAG: hypothetical protein IIU39_07910 [Ruminococcus sp.]|nr:hypothetical protein [Ruminococcus sp.]